MSRRGRDIQSFVLRPQSFSRVAPAIQKFDDSSGLVYDELSVTGPSIHRNWALEPPSQPPNVLATYRHDGPGPSSLQSMAIRSLLMNLRGLDAGSLRAVPWSIAVKIWKHIRYTGGDSFQVWASFATNYYNDIDGMAIFRYRRENIAEPSAPLDELLMPLQRLAPQFVTVLSISNVDFSRAQLIGLSKLPGLAVLDIQGRAQGFEHSFSEVDDSIVRAWSRAALEAGAFSQLRALVLRDHLQVTSLAFTYLRAFPLLKLYIISSRRGLIMQMKSAAKAVGWSHKAGQRFCEGLLQARYDPLAWDSQLRMWAFGSASEVNAPINSTAPPTFSLLIGPRHVHDLSWMFKTGEFLSFLRCEPVVPQPAAPKRTADEGPAAKKPRTIRANKQREFDFILNDRRPGR